MRISMSVAAKCAMPPIRNHRKTATKPTRCNEVLGSPFIAIIPTVGGIIRIHQAPPREAAAAPKALEPRRQPHPFGPQPQRILRLIAENRKYQCACLLGGVHHRNGHVAPRADHRESPREA